MAHSIVMPALSAGMEEATIARWLKKVGDAVAPGEVIAEIETDKATMELEAEHAGRIGRIIAAEGTTVAVNAPIALLLTDGEKVDSLGDAGKNGEAYPLQSGRDDSLGLCRHRITHGLAASPPRRAPAGLRLKKAWRSRPSRAADRVAASC